MELKINNHKNKILREQNNKLNELELKYKNKERDLERKLIQIKKNLRNLQK